jgi:hypothetical protein
VAEHEAASVAAGLPAGHKVGHGVLTGEDPAKRCLAGCRHDAAEAPDHAAPIRSSRCASSRLL